MDRATLHERIQLLLSWREQAAQHLRQERPATPIARARYQAQLRQAEFYLRQTIEQHQGHLQQLGRNLQMALAEKDRIAQRVAAGRINPQDAAMAQAEIDRRVSRVREEISTLNALLSARRAADAGGLIALPLDDYAPRLGLRPTSRPKDRWELRHYLVIGSLIIVASIASLAYYTSATGADLTCNAEYQPAPAEAAVFTLTNAGLSPLQLHVPWPDPIPAASGENDCGLNVFARRAGSDDLQLVPTMPEEWVYLGAPMTGQGTIDLQYQVAETVALDLRLMRARLAGLEAIRIDATAADGDVLCSQEWETLPAAPAGP